MNIRHLDSSTYNSPVLFYGFVVVLVGCIVAMGPCVWLFLRSVYVRHHNEDPRQEKIQKIAKDLLDNEMGIQSRSKKENSGQVQPVIYRQEN